MARRPARLKCAGSGRRPLQASGAAGAGLFRLCATSTWRCKRRSRPTSARGRTDSGAVPGLHPAIEFLAPTERSSTGRWRPSTEGHRSSMPRRCSALRWRPGHASWISLRTPTRRAGPMAPSRRSPDTTFAAGLPRTVAFSGLAFGASRRGERGTASEMDRSASIGDSRRFRPRRARLCRSSAGALTRGFRSVRNRTARRRRGLRDAEAGATSSRAGPGLSGDSPRRTTRGGRSAGPPRAVSLPRGRRD